MTWCVAHGYAATNAVNAATALLPKQPGKRDRVKHFPSVPWRQLPVVAEQLFSAPRQSTGRQALLFLILTGARSGEVRGATWQEFDFANQIWTIPAQRMKAGVQHRVPLSTQAIMFLQKRGDLQANHELTFKLDHLYGADQCQRPTYLKPVSFDNAPCYVCLQEKRHGEMQSND